MESKMSLVQALAKWDKKSAADIEQIYFNHHSDLDFNQQVLALCLSKDLSTGATWLLKHHVEQGANFSDEAFQQVLLNINSYTHWEDKLHVLQILSYFTITREARGVLEPFLKHAIHDSKKFVKAWSYSGLYELAKQYPELQNEVQELLNKALEDEPASVKARVRKLVKQGFVGKN